jgi:hypothetical protein
MSLGFSFLYEFSIFLKRFINIINIQEYSMINLEEEQQQKNNKNANISQISHSTSS